MEQYFVIASNNGRLCTPENKETKLITFRLENDNITGVRHEEPDNRDEKSIVNWAVSNNIAKLYVSNVSPVLHQSLTNHGVVVKRKEEAVNDPFLKRFIFL